MMAIRSRSDQVAHAILNLSTYEKSHIYARLVTVMLFVHFRQTGITVRA